MNTLAIIRPAASADVPTIGILGALLVEMHHELDPRRFIAATPQTPDRYGSYLGTQLKEPNVVILVAERNGEVVGYTYAAVEGPDTCRCAGRPARSTTLSSIPLTADRVSAVCS